MSDQLSRDLASLQIAREEQPPKKSPAVLIAVVVGIAALGVLLYTVGLPYLEAKIFRPEITTTEISVVSPAESSVELTSQGYVVAKRTSKVAAKVEGRISKIFVDEGDEVEAGAPIAELENAQEQSAIAAARARVLTSRARAETARANLSEMRAQAERQKTLAEKGAGLKATAEDSALRVRSLEETVKAADAEIAAAEAEVHSLSVTLGLMKIAAPIKGRVIERTKEVGEVTGPQSGAIVELADFASLLVETDVPEGRLYRVKVGSPCEIVLDAYPGKRHRGVVDEIVPRVNRAKATVAVNVKFVDALEDVLPDMAARVSFLDKPLDAEALKLPPKTVVPKTSVTERDGAQVVFALDGDQVRMKRVRLGPEFGGGYELVDGPPPGTRLIRNPPDTMTDGQRVKEKVQ